LNSVTIRLDQALVERGVCESREKAKRAIRRGFEYQQAGLGFSMIEVLSTCPTGWGLSPIDSLQWLKDNMIPYYPLGVCKMPQEAQ